MDNQEGKSYSLPILFLTIFIDLLGFGIVIPILPNYIKELTHSDVWVGVIAASFSIMSFFSTPILGTLSDKVGRRPVLILTTLLSAAGYLMFSFAVSVPLLLISRIISGMSAGNISVAQAYISDISTPENRTKRYGLIGAAFGLGFIFGPPIGGFLAAQLGWQSIGFFCCGLALLNLLLMLFALPESNFHRNKSSAIRLFPVNDLVKAYQHPVQSRLITFGFLYVIAFSMFQITTTLLWQEKYHYDESQRGFLFAFIGICTALVQGVFLGRIRKKFNEYQLLFWGSIIMGLTFIFMPFIPVSIFLPLVLTDLFLMSLANGGFSPSTISILSATSDPTEQGAILGLNQSLGSLARAIGPLLGTLFYSFHYSTPYLGAGLLCFIGLTLLPVIRKFTLENKI